LLRIALKFLGRALAPKLVGANSLSYALLDFACGLIGQPGCLISVTTHVRILSAGLDDPLIQHRDKVNVPRENYRTRKAGTYFFSLSYKRS
jgi:hypothetical protein